MTGLPAAIPHIHAFRKLSVGDMLFNDCFVLIRLEYFISHERLDPALEMIMQRLKPGG